MFQRKANLPARPPIPTKEEILDDLSVANTDDIVFNCEMINDDSYEPFKEETNEEADSNQMKPHNIQSPEEAYKKISSFVDKMNHLEERLILLKKEKYNLSKLEETLKTNMAEIQKELKKQTVL